MSNPIVESVNKAAAIISNIGMETKKLDEANKATETKIVTCTATKTDLYFLNNNGEMILINPCGECIECGLIFHSSYLYAPKDVEPDHWPVYYEGRLCKTCAEKL